MFQQRRHQSNIGGLLVMAEVTFHSIVRNIRSRHNNALVALGMSLMQVVTFVVVFYLMFALMGMRSSAVRGDIILYIMTGIMLFMLQTKTISAVAGAGSLNSPMMMHSPMNSIISIVSAAMSTLYLQVLTMGIILLGYHIIFTPVHIEDPVSTFGMVLMSWFSGVSIGLLLLGFQPWFPSITGILRTVYQRANMIASGKMFLANTLPSSMLVMFDWNPLFHIIDQSRGFAFINYNPHFTTWQYAFWLSVVFIVIGLMGEFFTRRRVSLSWSARR
ncbi:ABC transporter permease [Aliisedimentitalea scapharcae]|uniref:ABC transporter permease n=1 Tax=Aliisedimentitalea scapharcae TaxID=1524259 RepID=A0ABZ2XT64_9RHOB|nr:ABC transporter permease [Rhodobacteraceae bacterium M382]